MTEISLAILSLSAEANMSCQFEFLCEKSRGLIVDKKRTKLEVIAQRRIICKGIRISAYVKY